MKAADLGSDRLIPTDESAPFHDFNQLLTHREHLDGRKTAILDILDREQQTTPRVRDFLWFRNAVPLLGTAWLHLDRYVACHTGRCQPCRRWAYCPRCARQKRIEVMSRYYRRFHRADAWHKVTLSFLQDLHFGFLAVFSG